MIKSVESDTGVCVDVSWSAPEYPRGSIVGYNLNLTSRTHILTITTAGNVFFTTFYPTLYNTTYRCAETQDRLVINNIVLQYVTHYLNMYTPVLGNLLVFDIKHTQTNSSVLHQEHINI